MSQEQNGIKRILGIGVVGTGITCPYAFLSSFAVSDQTAAVALLPVVPGS